MNYFPKLVDLHQDLLLHINRRDLFPDHWQTNFDMLLQTNTKIVVATAFPVPKQEQYLDRVTNQMIESDFREYRKKCEQSPYYSMITHADQVLFALERPEHTSLILHVEGLNAITDQDWEMLERWYDLGWRSLGIVWNLTNSLGGGTRDPKTGLTELGAKLIRWCEEKGMLVDFAHMNAQTFADAARIVRRPILVSHGNACTLCNSPRNYTDEQLKLAARTQGVVGVFFARTYITGTQTAEIMDVANHIDHLVTVMGIEHVALGTDFGGIISGHVHRLDSLEALPFLWEELVRRGYSSEEIERIAWRNASYILQKHLTPYAGNI